MNTVTVKTYAAVGNVRRILYRNKGYAAVIRLGRTPGAGRLTRSGRWHGVPEATRLADCVCHGFVISKVLKNPPGHAAWSGRLGA